MENRIKERLTGALILVAIVVIFVPELLSGHRASLATSGVPVAPPATEGPPLRSYTMDLTAPQAPPANAQAALNAQPLEGAALPAPATAPAPDAPAPGPASPAAPAPGDAPPSPGAPTAQPSSPQAEAPAPTAKVPAVAAPPAAAAEPPAPRPKPEPPPATAHGGKGWYVQVGSFSKRENADHEVHRLAGKGFPAHADGPRGSMYRVRVGPVADRAAAQALQGRLAAQGVKGTLSPP